MPAVRGPRGPIPYERDALGYPRIRARDVLDGAYALGHLHAKDRLLQIQLLVSVARGRSMELFGDTPLFRLLDRVTHAFDFRGDLGMQIARIDDETRTFLTAYCDGFNAAANRRGRKMIYRLLGLDPGPHTPENMVLAYRLIAFFGLTSMQHSGESAVAEIVASHGPRKLIALLLGEPLDALSHLDRLGGLRIPEEFRLVLPQIGGSNAFAVAPSRSASGGALLMVEPHMEVGRFPPVLYATHIDYDTGGYYQGIGIPGIPWLSFGRTENVAWGYTYGHGDNVDTLVERVKRGKYLAKDEWRPLRKRTEEVRIRGKTEPERWTFWDNDYGTVLGDADAGGDLPCIRWSGLREIWRDVNAVLPAMRSRDVVELALHHRSTRCLSLNAILADTAGNIALVQTGQVDVRPEGWTGTSPYPGWDLASRSPQVLGEDERPQIINPPEGFVVTSNERRDGPRGERWCTLPEPNYRYRRLTQILSELDKADLDALVRASYDEIDLCAERLMAVWARFLPPAAEPLARWAARQAASGREEHRRMVGLFHTLHLETTRVLLARHLGGASARHFLADMGLGVVFQSHLDDAFALERLDVLSEAELESVLAHAWPAAIDRIARGKAVAPVRAGFTNVLLRGILPSALGFDLAPFEMPGGPTAPFQSRRVRIVGEDLVFGPAMHLVFDLSKPGGFYHVPGGASEERLGPGYGAGVDLWAEGRFIPLGSPEREPPSLAPKTERRRLGLPKVKLPSSTKLRGTARAIRTARARFVKTR
jgi:penicillin amidase